MKRSPDTRPGVYSITSTATGRVYYGASANVRARFREHPYRLQRREHPNADLQAHFDEYGIADLVFEFLEAEPDKAKRLALESMMIRAVFGPTCFNVAFRGMKFDPEWCARMSASMKGIGLGRKHSPETLARMSIAQTGKTKSPEHRAKISLSSKGRKHSPESNAQRSETLLGRKHSPEHRAAVAAARTGYRLTEAAKALRKENMARKRAANLQ